MLKTSKILVTVLGISTVGMGSYIAYTTFFSSPKKTVEKQKPGHRYFDTIPEKDSSLDKLNKILADNNAAKYEIKIPAGSGIETYENIDKNSRLYDSLVKAGSVVDPNANVTVEKSVFSENTVIRADKFIMKKLFPVLGYVPQKNNTDSLLNTMIDVKTPGKGKITLEFWESPVNYKGYRMGRDRMIVFGVLPDGVKMVKHGADLYMVTLNNVYLVKPCTEFCDLKPIKDKAVCAEVMSHAN
ncbi:MAG TPA: hypothetical protein VD905_13095 [Flavobacteriales bacterium]|nr:hypothetical protein [Flavobacteriales bacterium]